MDVPVAATNSQGSIKTSKSSKSRRTTKQVRVTANFIQSTESNDEENGTYAAKLKRFMNSLFFANCMVLVVLVDAFCTSAEIDARAVGINPSVSLSIISDTCLILYTIEAVVMFVLSKGQLRRCNWMIMLDWSIITAGWVELILERMFGDLGFHLAMMRPLRLVRIFRILRSLKRNRSLKELHKLAMMMATCFRTLLWSFLLCFIVMTVWAMLMVELIYPSVQRMTIEHGTFSDCDQCRRAMSSVMDANLLLFKTVIAGDSWGEIAVPVIQEHPATAIIFAGSLLSLVFGVLNLIVAVVVDTFAEARQNDVQSLAEEMEDEVEHDRQVLAAIFQRIDKDGSGELTLAELVKGAREDSIFHSRLRIMDIDEDDLQQLFHMIDQDGSGTVEVDEFIGPLSRWAHDSKTAPRFIKYNMLQSMHLQQDLYELSAACFEQLSSRIDDMAQQLCHLTVAPGASVENLDHDEGPGGLLPAEGEDGPSVDSDAVRRAKITCTELGLERVLHNLEMKLDALMNGARLASKSAIDSQSTSKALNARIEPARRPVRPMLHREAFRNMYMRPLWSPNPSSPRTAAGLDSQSLGLSLGFPRRTSTRSDATERSGLRSMMFAGFPANPTQSRATSREPPERCPEPRRVADL